MVHLPFDITPITEIVNPNIFKHRIFVKRDDLFTLDGGGSKARMLQYIFGNYKREKIDLVLTAGGPCSNFNRACSLQCAKLNIPLHIVSYTNDLSQYDTSLNYFITKLCDVKYTFCKKSNVKETIDDLRNIYSEQSINCKYVYGGGKSIEGIYAYFDAVKELLQQLPQSIKLDKVYVACGTGTTLSGISAGFELLSPNTEIHAISIARRYEDEIPVIKENLDLLSKYLQTPLTGENIFFSDRYLLGGYGKFSSDFLKFLKYLISNTGILFDPIYSGKAFYGMVKDLQEINSSNILFWHTGGLYTLYSFKKFLM